MIEWCLRWCCCSGHWLLQYSNVQVYIHRRSLNGQSARLTVGACLTLNNSVVKCVPIGKLRRVSRKRMQTREKGKRKEKSKQAAKEFFLLQQARFHNNRYIKKVSPNGQPLSVGHRQKTMTHPGWASRKEKLQARIRNTSISSSKRATTDRKDGQGS